MQKVSSSLQSPQMSPPPPPKKRERRLLFVELDVTEEQELVLESGVEEYEAMVRVDEIEDEQSSGLASTVIMSEGEGFEDAEEHEVSSGPASVEDGV